MQKIKKSKDEWTDSPGGVMNGGYQADIFIYFIGKCVSGLFCLGDMNDDDPAVGLSPSSVFEQLFLDNTQLPHFAAQRGRVDAQEFSGAFFTVDFSAGKFDGA